MAKIYLNISLTDEWPTEIILSKRGFRKTETYVYINNKKQNNIENRS